MSTDITKWADACRKVVSLNAEAVPPVYGLPPVCRMVVNDIVVKRQVPVEFGLAPMLAALSIGVGKNLTVNCAGYTNRCNLWLLTVADSGSNKSRTAKDILAPIHRLSHHLPPRKSSSRTPRHRVVLTLSKTTSTTFFNASDSARINSRCGYEKSVWSKLQIVVIRLAALASVAWVYAEGREQEEIQIHNRQASYPK